MFASCSCGTGEKEKAVQNKAYTEAVRSHQRQEEILGFPEDTCSVPRCVLTNSVCDLDNFLIMNYD